MLEEASNRLIFLVKAGHLGLAIGKNGKKINQVRHMVGKDVEIVEFNDNPKIFIRNCLAPARIKKVELANRKDGHQVLTVTVNPQDRGLAIGKAGKTISKARMLIQRHFGIQTVTIE